MTRDRWADGSRYKIPAPRMVEGHERRLSAQLTILAVPQLFSKTAQARVLQAEGYSCRLQLIVASSYVHAAAVNASSYPTNTILSNPPSPPAAGRARPSSLP